MARGCFQHRDSVHQRADGLAVVEKAHHLIYFGGNAISHGAAITTGTKNQPTLSNQLRDATAKGTATC
jgi:hypothetical protein